jgi:RHS repeat-associated protein
MSAAIQKVKSLFQVPVNSRRLSFILALPAIVIIISSISSQATITCHDLNTGLPCPNCCANCFGQDCCWTGSGAHSIGPNPRFVRPGQVITIMSHAYYTTGGAEIKGCELAPDSFFQVALVGHSFNMWYSYNTFMISPSAKGPSPVRAAMRSKTCGGYNTCVGHAWDFNTDYSDSIAPDRCTEGDPVDPYFGHLTITEQDYTVPDRGLSFDFARHYYSGQDECIGRADSTLWRYPLGQGWTHPYNLYVDSEWPLGITVDSMGNISGGGYSTEVDTVIFHDERGLSWLFKKDTGDSIYQMPPGCNFQLRRVGSRWTLYREDGSVLKFNSNGQLDTLDGRNGNKMAFSYDNRNNLSEIRSTTGKKFYLKYYSASADSHRLWKLYETSDTTSGPYFEYKYRVSKTDSVDTTSTNPSWRYQLTEVFHHKGGVQDQVELLRRYYYNYSRKYRWSRRLTVCFRPDTGYGGADTSYVNGNSSGDRLQCWYDTLTQGQVIYQEEVGKDNTLVAQAFFEYGGAFPSTSTTKVYHYKGSTGGSAHSVTDDSFYPSAPTSDYYVKTIKWWDSGNMRGIPAWTKVKDSTTGDSTVTTFARYNSNFKADSVVGPRGEVTVYTFQTDSVSGQPKRYFNLPKKIKYSTTDSVLSYFTKKDNNPVFFQPDSTKDENGYLRKFYYDSYGNDTAVVDTNRVLADSTTSNPQTLRTRFGYNKGNRVRVTDPKGNNTYFNYSPNDTGAYLTLSFIDMDASGDTSNSDIVTKYWYNTDRGLLDSMGYYQDFTTSSTPIKVRYKYDPLYHLRSVTYPDSAVDSLIYDKRGNVLEKWMRKAGTEYWHTLYSYDAMDHLTQVREQTTNLDGEGAPSYYTTSYYYNLDGNMNELRNAHSGMMSIYSTYYDYSMGRLIRVRYSDGTNDSLGYYSDGSLKLKRDRKSQVLGYEYDNDCSPCGRGRLTKKRYYVSIDSFPTHPSDSVKFTYDKAGDLTKVVFKGTSGMDSTLFAYDELYRLKQDSSVGFNRVIKYQYDLNGNRQQMRVINPSAGADSVKLYVSYPYWDRANRDSTIAVKVGANTYTWEMFYYDTGPLKRIVYPATTNLFERYNLTSRNFIASVIDSINGNRKFRNKYNYNAVGDRSVDSLFMTKPSGDSVFGRITWNYDNIRRLSATRYPASITGGDSAIYAYDAMGNRTSKTSGGSTNDYYYNLNNNQLTSEGAYSYTHDNNGNLVQKSSMLGETFDYGYDFENRLKRVKQLMSSDSVTYEYDGAGQRTRKVGLTDTTRYTWDGLYPVVEWNNQGKVKQSFIYANGLLLGLIDSTVYTNRRFFVLHDGLGSSVCMTNDSARIVRSFIYSDFGERLVDETAANTPTLNRLYASYSWDGSPANFYWMKYRQTYDPTVGRFGQEDPILQYNHSVTSCRLCALTVGQHPVQSMAPQVLNMFAYVLNNPINYADPSGEQAHKSSDCLGRYEPCRGKTGVAWWFCKNIIVDLLGCSGTKGATCCYADLNCCLEKLGKPPLPSPPDPDCPLESKDEEEKKCFAVYFGCLGSGGGHTRLPPTTK